MIDGNSDGSGDRQCTEAGQQTGDQQPASDHFREGCDVGQQNREGKVQGTHEGIREVFDVRQLLVAVMNQQSAGEDAQHEQTEIRRNRTGQDETNHRLHSLLVETIRNFMKHALHQPNKRT